MKARQMLNNFKKYLADQLRLLNTRILYYWILCFHSQPLTVSQKSAMVFAPHQDDETLGCGGLIALKRSLGVPIEVMFITDGRYGRPDWIQPEKIIDIRQQEAVKALTILGMTTSKIHFLNQVDGSLEHLTHSQREYIVNQIARRLQAFMPKEVYLPHRQDVHPDHEATYSLVKEAIAVSGIEVELLQYPIWMFWQNPLKFKIKFGDLANAYRLAINPVKDRKKRAIEAYPSQSPVLPSAFLQRFFLPYEIFFKQ